MCKVLKSFNDSILNRNEIHCLPYKINKNLIGKNIYDEDEYILIQILMFLVQIRLL